MEENKKNEIEMNSEVKQTNAQPVKTKKKSKVVPVLVTIILILILALALCIGNMYAMTNDYDNVFAMVSNMILRQEESVDEKQETEQESNVEEKNINLNFSFLQMTNEKENKVYSPLSIRYALKMLEDATSGDSKLQISKLIGNYNPTKYRANNNMSLANALFAKDTFKEAIKESYINTLKNKYDAEVIFDSFANAKNINNWIKNKTLNLIDNMLNDSDLNNDFMLINALGIDMEWGRKFLP